MNRREFIEKACLTGIGIVAGTSIINSLGIQSIKASPRPGIFRGNREIPIMLADTPDLQAVGGAYHLEIEEIEKNLLIVRTGEEEFIAVDIKCTHKGCDVTYQAGGPSASAMFVCPCHDSRFDLSGQPKSGPAKKPLGTYKTSFKNGEITIHVPLEGEPADGGKEAVKKDSTQKK